MDNIKLRLSKIEKSFPGVKALDKIDFVLRKGTVHALCGENGAGKSTLMKIINGIYKPDSGEMYIDGKLVRIKDPIDARKNKISMIAQELNYISEMSVEENIFLGRLPVDKFGKIKWKEVREESLKLLEAEELDFSPSQKMKTLTVSDIQMLEIIKAISVGSDIIVMDEPTSSITQKEVETLFEKINMLRDNGVSIIYISHKMDEVFKIADDITVFRDGKSICTKRAEDFSVSEVISTMVGREIENVYPKENATIGKKVLEVVDLCSEVTFDKISFNIKSGEIVGFAGLVGSGRTEVMRCLFGLDKYDSGKVFINNKETKIKNPSDSIKNKIVMLSEDRKRYGIIPIRSVLENATISSLDKVIYKGYLHKKEEEKIVKEYFDILNVKTPSIHTLIQSLSGGNQQKVLFARWIMTDPQILILDEPTRGIDVGAKFEIYKLISNLAKEGKAVIIVSSELPELIGMCDRIYVMNQGRISGEISKVNFSQEVIMQYATK